MPTLGTATGRTGEPDNPLAGNNVTIRSLVGKDSSDPIVAALTDLDPATDENRFVYAETEISLTLDTSALTGVVKAVSNDLVGLYTKGQEGQEEVTVYEGHNYTYRLRVSSSSASSTKGIVLYDTIENYHIPSQLDLQYDSSKQTELDDVLSKKNWESEWAASATWRGGQWRGTLNSVDVSDFIAEGAAPAIYYSTQWDLQFGETARNSTTDEKQAVYTSGAYVLSDGSIWNRVPASSIVNGVWTAPAGVTAIAIDASLDANGNDFVLPEGKAMNAYLHMTAPAGDSAKSAYYRPEGTTSMDDIDWDKALEADNNMHAYNNTRMLCYTISKSTTSSLQMIRNDYTRVGIVPQIVAVTKEWDDNNNHDGQRPPVVKVDLYRRLVTEPASAAVLVDTVELTKDNDWSAVFEQVDPVDENGTLYIYSYVEQPISGDYTYSVSQKNNQIIITNHRTDETIDIPAHKEWKGDDDNAAGDRPKTIRLELYRAVPGEEPSLFRTANVQVQNGNTWNYTFTNLPKYKAYEGPVGEWDEAAYTYEYTIKEILVERYESAVSEDVPYTIINTYHPYADLLVTKTLENATPQAAKTAFEYTIYLNDGEKTVETEDGVQPAPLFDRYAYTVYSTWVKKDDAGNVVATNEDSSPKTGLIGNGESFTLLGGETLVIADLPAGSTWRIEEADAEGFTLTGVSGDTGTVYTTKENKAAFTNTYNSKGTVQFVGRKHLIGGKLKPNQFRFTITDQNGNMVFTNTRNSVADEEGVYLNGDKYTAGDILFGSLVYTNDMLGEDGTAEFVYTIREAQFTLAGYELSSEEYQITVRAVDNGDGTISTTKYWTGEEMTNDRATIIFHNKYSAKGQIDLVVWKELVGRPLKAREFQFILYRLNDDGSLTELTSYPYNSTYNDAEGKVTFPALPNYWNAGPNQLCFDQDDLGEDGTAVFYYVIKEFPGKRYSSTSWTSDPTVEYSDQVYLVQVTVADMGDGTLSVVQGTQDARIGSEICTGCHGTGHRLTASSSYRYLLDGEGSVLSSSLFKKYNNNTDWQRFVCPECLGYGVDENGVFCDNCHGTGIYIHNVQGWLGGTYEHGIQYLPGSYRQVKETDTDLINAGRPVGSYVYTLYTVTGWDHNMNEIDEWRYAWIDPYATGTTCPYCGGAGFLIHTPNEIQEESPVFTNNVKPGNLTIRKKVNNLDEAPDPDQEFTFHVKLSSPVVPEKVTYTKTKTGSYPTLVEGSDVYNLIQEGRQDWSLVDYRNQAYLTVDLYYQWDIPGAVYFYMLPDDWISLYGAFTWEYHQLDYFEDMSGSSGGRIEYIDGNDIYDKYTTSDYLWDIYENPPHPNLYIGAHWKGIEFDAEVISDTEFTIKLKANETGTITNLFPAGTNYEVWEETETGWVLVESSDVTGTIAGGTTPVASFTNEYKPGVVKYFLEGKKLLDETEAEADSFSFELWDGVPDADGSTLIETVKNQNNGAIMFAGIEFVSQDLEEEQTETTLTYYIREKQNWYQDAEDMEGAYVYDAAVVKAEVKITRTYEEEIPVLTAVVTYDGQADRPVFKNTKQPGKLEISKKTVGATAAALEGVEADETLFSITLQLTDAYGRTYYEVGTKLPYKVLNADGDQIGTGEAEVLDLMGRINLTIKPDTTLLFEELKEGTRYKVTESGLPEYWKEDGSENAEGAIAANVTSQAIIKNAYSAKGKIVLNAQKHLIDDTLTANQFSAVLYQPADPETAWLEANNDADGIFTFDAIAYTLDKDVCIDNGGQTGVYDAAKDAYLFTYLLKEVTGNDNSIIYDTTVYQVTVTVTDNGDGTLTAEKTVAKGEESAEKAVFVNKKKPGDLSIKKILIDPTTISARQPFAFTLTLTDADEKPITGEYPYTVSIGGPASIHPVIEPVAERMGTITFNGALEIVGRAFTEGDQITVTVTCNDDNAPLPENNKVTFHPTAGADAFQWVMDRMYFSIEDDNANYTYTITVKVDSMAGTDAQSIYTYTVDVSAKVLYDGFDRPESIQLTPASGDLGNLRFTYGNQGTVTFDENGQATLTILGNETLIIPDLPHGAQYTITENNLPGYILIGSSGESGEIVATGTSEVEFTNEMEQAFQFFLDLEKLDEKVKPLPGAMFQLVKQGEDAPAAVEVSADGTVFTFSDLSEGDYILTETKTPVGYVTMEPVALQVAITYDENGYPTNAVITTADAAVTVRGTEVVEDEQQKLTTFRMQADVANELILIDIDGSKTWEDNEDQDGKRPASITINLLADGEKIASKTVTKEDNWKWSFTDLPEYSEGKKIDYTVTEDPVTDYTTEIEGYDVINTHVAETIEIPLEKKWDDAEDKDDIRPESISVKLLANGEPIKTVTLRAGEDGFWKYTFTDLPKYSEGKLIRYTVEEELVAGYSAEVSGSEEDGFVIIKVLPRILCKRHNSVE